MKRPAALLAVILLLVGCQSTKSTFDPFAIYGPRRVPPPATGTIGQPHSYDQPPATLPAAPPVSSSLPPVNLQQPPSGLPPRQTRISSDPNVSSASATHWQPAAAPNSSTASAEPSSGRSDGARIAAVREANNLRWTRHELTALPNGRPTSAEPPASLTQPPPLADPTLARAAQSRLADPTLARAAQYGPASVVSSRATPPRGAGSKANEVSPGGEPKPFSPSGQLLEITELPGYTPSTFSPSVGYPAPASAHMPLPNTQVSAPPATPVASGRSSSPAKPLPKTDPPRSSDELGWKQRTTP